MKKLLLSIGCVLIVSGLSQGAMAAEANIAVVDFQKIMHESPQVKATAAKLRQQFEPENKKIADKQKALEDMMKKYEKDNAVMSATDKKKNEEQIMQSRQELMKLSNDYQQKLFKTQEEELQKILGNVNKIIEKIAQERKFDFVMARDMLAYANPKSDITADVQKNLK